MTTTLTFDEMTARMNELNAELMAENAYIAQYPYNVTSDEIKAMNKADRRALYNALSAILDTTDAMKVQWDLAYSVFLTLEAINDAEYYAENIESFNAWCEEHIWSKDAEDISPEDYNFYSDWHKDMYGYRPHGTARGW